MSRRIPKAIKEEIIGKVQVGERVAELSEQYAVSSKTIYGWLRQDSDETVASMLQYNELKCENEERRGLIGELTPSMLLQKSQVSGWLTQGNRFKFTKRTSMVHNDFVGADLCVCPGGRTYRFAPIKHW